MSAVAETPASTGSNGVNVRAFLAGGGATTALIAAAVIAFLSVAALVAFNGLPIGGGEDDASTVQVGEVPANTTGPGAPEAAAAALAAAPGAVADSPAAATAIDPTLVPGFGAGPGGLTGGADGVPGTPGAPTAPGTGAGGALGGAVGGVDDTAGDLGLDVPLDEVTGPITGPLDQTINDTLNNVGGALGNPNLGNQVTDGVNNITNGVLGRDGVVGNLLNP